MRLAVIRPYPRPGPLPGCSGAILEVSSSDGGAGSRETEILKTWRAENLKTWEAVDAELGSARRLQL